MDSQDDPIRHFGEMSRFTAVLKALPAQILDHSYSYESFGSWAVSFRYKGRSLRLVFDGRDNAYSLACSASRKPPHSWTVVWRRPGEEVASPYDERIIDAIRDANSAV